MICSTSLKWQVLAELVKLRLFLVPGASWVSVRRILAKGGGRVELVTAGLCFEGPE